MICGRENECGNVIRIFVFQKIEKLPKKLTLAWVGLGENTYLKLDGFLEVSFLAAILALGLFDDLFDAVVEGIFVDFGSHFCLSKMKKKV